MKTKHLFGVLVISMLLLAIPAVLADSQDIIYTYLIGTDNLPHFPTIAMASNGDTIAMSGIGTFHTKSKLADGGGTFVHKDASGNVLGSGSWTATRLVSFKSYGNLPDVFPPEFEGGLALLKVHLNPSGGGAGFDAVMQVDCLIGDTPAGAKEGIRLVVQDTDLNFNKEVHGDTLFIRH